VTGRDHFHHHAGDEKGSCRDENDMRDALSPGAGSCLGADIPMLANQDAIMNIAVFEVFSLGLWEKEPL